MKKYYFSLLYIISITTGNTTSTSTTVLLHYYYYYYYYYYYFFEECDLLIDVHWCHGDDLSRNLRIRSPRCNRRTRRDSVNPPSKVI